MEVLYSGLLKDQDPFYIRKLLIDDLEAIWSVQNEIIQTLENRSSLPPLTKEGFQHILMDGGSIVGVFVDEKLVAFRAALIPGEDHEHLGYDIGLDPSEHSSVIYQEISNVLPLYRGYRLQKIMAEVLMEQLRDGDFKHICATVAPFNILGLKDQFSHEMEIVGLKKKYNKVLRYVFVKDLHPEGNAYEKEQFIPMYDTAAQQKLLADGWRGTEVVDSEDGWMIHYEK